MRRSLLFTMLLALLATSGLAPAQPVAGVEYQVLRQPQPTGSPGKIEVLEFFWYGCPHCNNLQPALRAWLEKKPDDVAFRSVPAVLSDGWLPLTRAFYALEAMDLTEKFHHALFTAIHQHKVRLQDPNVLFDWLASRGVDRKKFADTYHSFGIESRVRRAVDMTRSYDVPFTPAVVVDGRYLSGPSMTLKPDRTVDYDSFFRVLDQLIAMARKAHAGK
jgi:protein dithiol oxidoreductase (disulfide-forming)